MKKIDLDKGFTAEEKKGLDKLFYKKSLMYDYVWGGCHLWIALILYTLLLKSNLLPKSFQSENWGLGVGIAVIFGLTSGILTRSIKKRLNQIGLAISALFFFLGPLILLFLYLDVILAPY